MTKAFSCFPYRYLPQDILMEALDNELECVSIGQSVEGRSIYCLRLGTGSKKILGWSQMHGNETTTTRGLFDFIERIKGDQQLLRQCSFAFILQLNPDGAFRYTRENANNVDLNRDALDVSQPETKAFMDFFEAYDPDLCLNLHDQRTRFTVGTTKKEAALSFLAPSADTTRTYTKARLEAIRVISYLYLQFNRSIQTRIGRFDDSFNSQCFGDYLTQKGVPTILVEAGQWGSDYDRVISRRLVYETLQHIVEGFCKPPLETDALETYLSIPENTQYGYDLGYFDPTTQHWLGMRYSEHLRDEGVVFREEPFEKLDPTAIDFYYFRG